jgi:hypothetical protein
MKTTHLAVRWLMLVSMFIYSLGPEPLWANPTGGQVVDGSATISSNGSTLTVNQTTNRAIINWQSFSIGQGELTSFIQPSASSANLSRVLGGDPSQLLGSLTSNGQVYLINPSGIVFGQGFQLNTSGFLASTLDVDNGAFMSGGNLHFAGNSTAGITNNGTLTTTAGDVYLFARSVTNNGTINSAGTAGLAAGSDILLASSGDQRVYIQAGSQSGTVINKGTVQAVAAELKAVGGNAGALAINNTGTVRATGVVNKGGHIWLTAINGDIANSGSLVAQDSQGNGGAIEVVASSDTPTVTPATVTNSGVIDASGKSAAGSVGGSVVVTGDNVQLAPTSLIDVSGNAGGGSALIGGGSHGTDASVLDAQATTVESGAEVLADALLTGNGGNVVVWSNNDTEFFGGVSARGGAQSGNGGNVEVSGGYLNFQGNVNTLAAHGAAGNLLLDPINLTISNGTTTNIASTGTTTDTPSAAPSVLSWTNLITQLGTGNVLVTTSGTGTGAAGNITVATNATFSSGFGLTLTTASNGAISFANAVSVTNNGTGSLILNAGSGGISFGGAGAGAVDFASINATATGGAISVGSGETLSRGTVNLQAGTAMVVNGAINATGAISLSSSNNLTISNASLTSGSNISLTSINGGNVSVSNSTITATGGEVDLTTTSTNSGGGAVLEDTNSTITATSVSAQASGVAGGESIELLGTSNSFTNFAAANTGTGKLDINDNALITIGTVNGISGISSTNGNTLNLSANGITVNPGITINTGNARMVFNANTGAYQFNNSTLLTTSSNTNAVSITTGSNVALGNINAANGGVAIGLAGHVGGTITQNAGTGIVAGDLTTFTAAGTTINLSSTSNNIGSVAAINSPASFTLNDGTNSLTVASITIGTNVYNGISTGTNGAVTLTSGALTLNAPITTAGTNGTVTLKNSGAISGTGLLTTGTLTFGGSGDVGSGTNNRINTAVSALDLPYASGNIYLNQTGALNITGTGTGVGGVGTTVDILGSGSLTFTGAVSLASGVDAVLRFAGGTITGQGSGSNDLTFGSALGATDGSGTVELLSGTGISSFQDAGNGITLAFNNSTSSNVQIDSLGGLVGTDIKTTGNVSSISNTNGTITVNGHSPLYLDSSMTATAINLSTLDDQAGDINNITVGSAGTVVLNATGSGGATLQAGNSVIVTNGSTVEASGTAGNAGPVWLEAQTSNTDKVGNIVLNNGIITSAGGVVELEINNDIGSTTATISQSGGQINAATGLLVYSQAGGGSTVTLTSGTNSVGTLAANINGALSYTDSSTNGLTVSTVTGVDEGFNGIGLQGGALAITASNELLTEAQNINTAFVGNNITLLSQGFTQNAGTTMTAGAGQISINGQTGAVALNGTVTTTFASPTPAGSDYTGYPNSSNALTVQGATISQGTNGVFNVANGVTRLVTTSTNAGNVSVTNDGSLSILDSNMSTGSPYEFMVGGNLAIDLNGGTLTQVNATPPNGIAVAGTTTLTNVSSNNLSSDSADVFGGGFQNSNGDVLISHVGPVEIGNQTGEVDLTPFSLTGNLTVKSVAEGYSFTGALTSNNAIVLNGTANNLSRLSVQTGTAAGSGYKTNQATSITQDTQANAGSITMLNPLTTYATFITENSASTNNANTANITLAGGASNDDVNQFGITSFQAGTTGTNVSSNKQTGNVSIQENSGDFLLGSSTSNVASTALGNITLYASTGALVNSTLTSNDVITVSAGKKLELIGASVGDGSADADTGTVLTAASSSTSNFTMQAIATQGDIVLQNTLGNVVFNTINNPITSTAPTSVNSLDASAGGAITATNTSGSYTVSAPVLGAATVTMQAQTTFTNVTGATGSVSSEGGDVDLSTVTGAMQLNGLVGSNSTLDVHITANGNLATGSSAAIQASDDISITSTTGSITLGDTVAASGSPTIEITSAPSSSGTILIGANIGQVNSNTDAVTITNGGTLSTSNSAVVYASTVTLDGTGAVENAGPNAGLNIYALDLILNESGSTGPLWVFSENGNGISVGGVVDSSFYLKSSGTIVVGDSTYTGGLTQNSANLVDLRTTSGDITTTNGAAISATTNGASLNLAAAGEVGGLDPTYVIDQGNPSTLALQLSGFSKLSGTAGSGFYITSTNSPSLTIGSNVSPLGTVNGIDVTGAGGVIVNTDGNLTVAAGQGGVTTQNNYIQLVTTGTNASVNVNAQVSSGNGAGGTLYTNGQVNISSSNDIVLGSADIYLATPAPDSVYTTPLTINGNWTILGNIDIIIQAPIGTSNGDLTLHADADGDGLGGLLISNGIGHGGSYDGQAFAHNGSVFIEASDLYNGQAVGTAATYDTIGNVSGYDYGSSQGNAVVFNTSAAGGAVVATKPGGATDSPNPGNVTISINPARTGTVVQDGTNTMISAPGNLTFFGQDTTNTGDGNVGVVSSTNNTFNGTINPIVINVPNIGIYKVQPGGGSNTNNNVYLDSTGNVTLADTGGGASTTGNLDLLALTGSINETSTLTANNLTLVAPHGSVSFGSAAQDNSVNKLDLGYAGNGTFAYFGNVALEVTGAVSYQGTITGVRSNSATLPGTTINIGTNQFTQDVAAPIIGQNVFLTFGIGSESGQINGSSTVTINNGGLFTQNYSAVPLPLITTQTLNLNDLGVEGNQDVGTALQPILISAQFLNFNRTNSGDPTDISSMYLSNSRSGGLQIQGTGGSAVSYGNLTLTQTVQGNITEGGGIVLDNSADTATLSVTTTNGFVNLATNTANTIDAFGTITVVAAPGSGGYFLYDGSNAQSQLPTPNPLAQTLQLNGAINTSGNVAINMGQNNNIVQSASAPINAAPTTTTSGSLSFAFATGTFNAVIGNSNAITNTNTAAVGVANPNSTLFSNATDAVAFYTSSNLTLNPGANVFARDSVTEYDVARIAGTGVATVDLGANITTYGATGGTPKPATITFQSAVYLIAKSTLTADKANPTFGNIVFEQTLDDDTPADKDVYNLTALARNGNILFDDVIGGYSAPGNIVAETNGTNIFGTSSNEITVEANSITTGGAAWTTNTPTASNINTGTTALYASLITSDGFNNALDAGIIGGQVYGNHVVMEEPVISLVGGNTTTASNNIYFLSTLNGSTMGGNDLILTPGAGANLGSIAFVGDIGGTTRLGNITVTNAANVDVNRTVTGTTNTFGGSGGLTAETFTQDAGSGNTTFGLSAVTETNAFPNEGAIDLAGSTVTGTNLTTPSNYPVNDSLPTAAALYINGHNVTFNSGASVNTSYTTTTTNAAGVVIINSGTLTMVQGSDMGFNAYGGKVGNGYISGINTPGLDGQFLQLGTGPVVMGNDITTKGYTVFFNGGVTFNPVTAPVASTTTNPPAFINSSLINTTGSGITAGADIVFNSAINGQTADANNVTLNAGTGGNIGFFGPAGTSTSLGDLVIANAHNVTDNSNSIQARDFYQAAGTGVTTINGLVTTDSNTFNETNTPTAMLTPTSAASSIATPTNNGPGTGGGIQVATQYIDISNNMTANGGGEILFTAQGVATGTNPTSPLSNPYAALLIEKNATTGNGAVVTANGGGNIYLNTTSTSGADVIISGGSQVETAGGGSGNITIVSSDDVVLDGTGGVTEGLISTTNGNISITADNNLLEPSSGPPDNANGVVIEASSDAAGVIVSATGTLTITSTLTTSNLANGGELEILGGNVPGASALVTSTSNMSVAVAGGTNTLGAAIPAGNVGVVVLGGTGINDYASLTTTTTNGTQSIVAQTGNVIVEGGTANLATASIISDAATSTSDQNIQVQNGNLFVLSGTNSVNTGAEIGANADGATQIIDVYSPNGGSVGSITVTAGGGNAVIANGFFESEINNQFINADQNITLTGSQTTGLTGDAGFLAGGNQTITAGNYAPTSGTILVQGGTQASSPAAIESYGNQISNVISTTQSITVNNANHLDSIGNFTVQGGDGTNSFAEVMADNLKQSIVVNYGNLNVLGDQNAANFGSIAAIVASNNGPGANQAINVIGNGTTSGNINVTGGIGNSTVAAIEADDTQTIGGPIGASTNDTPISGNITLQGGGNATTTNNFAAILSVSNQYIHAAGVIAAYGSANSTVTSNDNEAVIYGASTTNSAQTVIAGQGIILSGQKGDTSTTNNGDLYSLGAAIIADNTQSITVTSNGGLTMLGGTLAGSAAAIDETAAANPSATQTISVTGTTTNNAAYGIVLQGGTAANGDEAIIYSSNSASAPTVNAQSITSVTGGIFISGNGADSIQNFGNVAGGIGAGIVATNSQFITTLGTTPSGSGLTLLGGHVVHSAAVIDEQALTDTSATQTLAIYGTTTNDSTDGIYLEGGIGLNAQAMIYSGNSTSDTTNTSQVITAYTGGIYLNGNQASSSAYGNIPTLGAGIIAENSQSITVSSNGGLALLGGSVAGSAAVIDEPANPDSSAVQTIAVSGVSDLNPAYGIILQGGTAADGDEALIYSGNSTSDYTVKSQSITASTGGILISGNGADSQHQFGDAPNLGAGIVATNSQFITTTSTTNGGSGLTLLGGSVTGSAAVIDDQANTDTSATQTLAIYGTTTNDNTQGIYMLGGTAGNGDEAIIYSGNSTSAPSVQSQSITAYTGGIYLNGNGGASLAQIGDVDSLGAGIVATNSQSITVSSNGGLTLLGGNVTGSAATIDDVANTDTSATQTIAVTGVTDFNSAYGIIVQGGTSDGEDEALIYSGNTTSDPSVLTQSITASTAGILINGNGATSDQRFGDLNNGLGAGIVANNTQFITTTSTTNGGSGLSILGGSVGNSAAVIDDVAKTGKASSGATQTLAIYGTTSNDNTDGIYMLGGTADFGDEAMIYSGNSTSAPSVQSQSITAYTGGIYLNGNGGASQQKFGDVDSLGAGIIATNSQSITVSSNGGLTLLGGNAFGSAAVIDDEANTDTSATQTIAVTGTTTNPSGTFGIYLLGGTAANEDEALIYSGNTGSDPSVKTQSVTSSTGGIYLNGNGADSQQAFGTLNQLGAGIVATNTQAITVSSNGGLELLGGSVGGSAAVIDETASVAGASQTLTISGTNSDGYGIELEGGTTNDTEAVVYSANTQTVTTTGPGIYLFGNQAYTTTTIGNSDFSSFGAGIISDNTQDIEAQSTTGSLTLQGGTVPGSAAIIDETASVNGTGTQTVLSNGNSTGTNTGYGIQLLGGTDGTNDEAIIYSNYTQTITANNGGLNIDAMGASSTFQVTTSEIYPPAGGPYYYHVGAGILANNDQTINVSVNNVGNLNLQGAGNVDGAPGSAVIGMLNTGVGIYQDVSVGHGSLLATGGNNANTAQNLGAAAGIVSYGFGSGSGTPAQMISVLHGNIVLTASQDADGASYFRDAFIDLFAGEPGFNNIDAYQSVTVGQNTPTPIAGYISIQAGAGLGDYGYISSNANQTIFAEGGTPVSGPFAGTPLGLGVTGNSSATSSTNAVSYNEALVHSDGNQSITVESGNVEVIGGSPKVGGDDVAGIFTTGAYNGTQTVSIGSATGTTNDNGNLIVNGGGTGVSKNSYVDGDTNYFVSSALVGSAGAQTITVDNTSAGNSGNISVLGGSGTGGAANIESRATQAIGTSTNAIAGTIKVEGMPSASNTLNVGGYAAITSAQSQSINVTGNLLVLGSPVATASLNDDYAAIATDMDQTITVGGYIHVLANSASSDANNNPGLSLGPLGEPGVPTGLGAVIVALNLQGGGVQSITANGSDTNSKGLVVEGGSNGVGQTAALVEQYDTPFDQQIDVTSGGITVAGGTDNAAYAEIDSQYTQEIGYNHNIGGTIMVQGGGTSSNTGAYAAINAVDSQTINAAGDIDVTGTTAANTTVSNDDYALIQSGNVQQIYATGSLNVAANYGSSGGFTGPLTQSGLGAAVISTNNQDLWIGAGDTTGILTVLGGTGTNSGASVQMNTVGGFQDIDVNGKSTTTNNLGDSVDVIGGSGPNAYASILSSGNQKLGYNFTGSPIAGNVIVKAGSGGTVTGGAYATIQSGSTGDYYQEIYANGSIKVLANTDVTSAGGGYASLISYGYQDIESYGGTGITVAGGTTTNDSALIETFNTAGDNEQLISAVGTTNDNISVTGGSGLNAAAGIIDGNSDAADGQQVEAGGSTGFTISAGSGTNSTASIDMQSTSGYQRVLADNGSVAITDGNGGDAYINSNATSNLVYPDDQYVSASQVVTLSATHGHNAYISGAGIQTVNTGLLNMTGTNNGEAYITAIHTVLNMNSGTGTNTWTGNSVIGTDGVTQYVEINNAAPIVVATPPTGHIGVFADAGTGEIEFDGAGQVATTNSRLVTQTNLMQFDNSSKSLYLEENLLPVALEGTLKTLDLTTTNTPDGQDAVTTTNPGLTATTAGGSVSITTSSGGINLTTGTNDIAVFGTINAQGTNSDEFQYAGMGNTALNGPVTATTFVDLNVGTSNSITFNNGNVTSGTYQTYESNVILGTNSLLTAGTAGTSTQSITFEGTLAGAGVNSLEIAGGNAYFNLGAGQLLSPLYDLTFDQGTSGNFYPDTTSTSNGATTLVAPALVLNHSLINNSTLPQDGQITINDTAPTTLVVDNGTSGPGSGIFQGGNIDITTAGNVTFYVPNAAALTGAPVLGSEPLPTTQVFKAWLGSPTGPNLVMPYALNTVFFKTTPPQTLVIPFPSLDTFYLSNVSNGLFFGYLLGGDANNPGGGTGENGGSGSDQNGGTQDPGTIAGAQQYPFISIINVAGYGPGADDNGGQVWIGSGTGGSGTGGGYGYLTFGSSDELRAGFNSTLWPTDEKHWPKKLKHKPISWVPPQLGGSGANR